MAKKQTKPEVPEYLKRPWDYTIGYNDYEREIAYQVRLQDMEKAA